MKPHKQYTALLTTLTILLLALPLTLASATQPPCEIRHQSCEEGEVAIASTNQATNAHAALASYEDFEHLLCCNEEITDTNYDELEEMFSVADNEGQGHISAAGNYPQAIQGNWQACQLTAGSCNTDDGEQCLARITNSGEINGEQQGHIATCSDESVNTSICCCPTGSEWNSMAGACEEYFAGVGVIVTGPSQTTAPVSITEPEMSINPQVEEHEAYFEWGWDSPLTYEIYTINPLQQQETIAQGTFESYRGTATVEFEVDYTHGGDWEVCATAEKDDGTTETYCQEVDAEWRRSDISGTVRLEESDGSIRRASGALVRAIGLPSGYADQPEYAVEANELGEYEFEDIRINHYSIEVVYLDAYEGAETIYLLDDQPITGVDFTLQEITYNADCTNARGRCDRNALGRNGCLEDENAPNYEQRVAVLEACHPEGSHGRLPGDQVIMDRNSTHQQTALCCTEVPQWVETPKADVQTEVDADNLIKYTRLVNYLGRTVRLNILTWN